MSPSIPEKQWAQVFEKSGGPIDYKEIPVPKPGPDEVLVNIKFSGVCHTDLHFLSPGLTSERRAAGGHEGAGVVVARGELVTDVEIGDHAGIKWLNGSCLACDFCQQMDEPLCPKALLSGYTVDGTFQEYAIGKAAHVARIPKDVELSEVAPILCAGITVYKGLKESGAKPGQLVAIVGAGGGLGSIACQYAKAMGLRVIAIDAGDEKKEMTTKLGAEAFIDFSKSSDVVKDVQAATGDGLGPHAVLLVAVNEKPFQQATQVSTRLLTGPLTADILEKYVRPHGTVVAIGLPANAFLKAPVFETVLRCVTIKGSYVGNRKDTTEAIDFFRRGLIKAPIKIVGMSQLQKVYNLMHEGKIAGRYVVDTSK
ncbi:MAG: hypothetical protein Q9187_009500 [Circinaria calcarea]